MASVRRIHSKKDKLAFVRMLWDIYQDYPLWVAPLEMDRIKLIDQSKNPFYEHSDSAFFIAEENGKVTGRIAAIVNHNHNSFHKDTIGFFGFFECVNNVDTARSLFTEAERFLKSQGMTSARGPYNPSSNDECGVLIDGFDSPPVILTTYNPPYYAELIEMCGYHKQMDLYAWHLSTQTAFSEKLERITSALQERNSVVIRKFNKNKFDEEVARIKALYNQAWEKNWGFVPLTDKEFDALVKDLKIIYDPDAIIFAEKNGKTVGFSLSLPDINQAFHGGRRIPSGLMNLPIGLWNLLTKKKKITTIRIIILGIEKEYRSMGIDGMLYRATIDYAKKKGYAFGEASWILEINDAMNRALKMMNGTIYKTYRIFEKALV